ncbi:MAG: TIM barrel protein [Xanthobacteraceae bacterium]
MPTIGFSTGALALGDFERGLSMLASKDADAVELSALRSVELLPLLNAVLSRLGELQQRYRYISFHAPTDYQDECELVERLRSITERGFNVVVHPDTICDLSLWQQLGNRLCIENMDSRKATGRTAKELRGFFDKLPQARLCFDVAHARQVDPTMTEATRILSEFGDRLAQVHLSEINGKGKHFVMSFIAKRAYHRLADVLASVPVILESPVNEEGIDSELQEAQKVLTQSRSDATSQIASVG